MTAHKRYQTTSISRPSTSQGDTSSSRHHSGARNTGVKQSAPEHTGDPKVHFNRYMKLAQSAEMQGEKIDSENYYQHAEHFFRTMKFDKNGRVKAEAG